MYLQNNLPIKAWAEEDRPREKLLLKGKNALSNAELIAILIGSGSRKQTAVELSKEILNRTGNNLNKLGKYTIAELMEFKGIGEAKAISIIAALELGRRRKSTEAPVLDQIVSSYQAYQYILPFLEDLKHEEFWVICLNKRNVVLKCYPISRGGLDSTIIDVKFIFATAIKEVANSIMLFHNHPAGAPHPSNADIKETKKIVEAGLLLDIKVLDHIIVGDNKYYSFADNGLI
ncbi:MAG: DNA repair protein RadC [Chitinophagales bacterium]